MSLTESQQSQPFPTLFTIAVLAIKNTPTLLTASGAKANPATPQLYSLTLFAQNLPANVDQAQEMLCRTAADIIRPELPPGYMITVACANPVPVGDIMKAAATIAGTGDELPEGGSRVGQPFYDPSTGDAVLNTFRVGIDANMRSPRMGMRCPVCGTCDLRLTGDVDARTPDGYRIALNMDADETEHVSRAYEDPYGSLSYHNTPVTVDEPDSDPAGPWRGMYTGVSLDVTCRSGHVFTMRYIEDTTPEAPDRGPTLFLVFEYKDPAPVLLNTSLPGTGTYPVRTA